MIYLKLASLFKHLTRSSTDDDLSQKLLIVAWCYLVIVFVQSQFFPAPYGKFNTTNPIFLLEKIRYTIINYSDLSLESTLFQAGLLACKAELVLHGGSEPPGELSSYPPSLHPRRPSQSPGPAPLQPPLPQQGHHLPAQDQQVDSWQILEELGIE